MKIPILLIAFNRPELTKKVIDAIRTYKPDRLYFAVNSYRVNLNEELTKVEKVKSLIKEIDWKCNVSTLFRNEHLLLKYSVSSAINWFFENEDMGIILEDDIVPDSSFFLFCEELLIRYKDNEKIGMISANNFSFGKNKIDTSYYFSIYSHIWGWASWRRAWQGYDVDMIEYQNFKKNKLLEKLFNDQNEINFWYDMFDKVAFDNFNTWDFQWVFHNMKSNRLNIMPSVNLIENLGFGIDASHTHEAGVYKNLKKEQLIFPLTHPPDINQDIQSDAFSKKLLNLQANSFSLMSIFRKIKTKIYEF
ncbi:MAG: glycosyl transferase [Leptospira sp.]|nr:glycosyl transferase [Leptospira sp.]